MGKNLKAKATSFGWNSYLAQSSLAGCCCANNENILMEIWKRELWNFHEDVADSEPLGVDF
jgi:hypothetical protein